MAFPANSADLLPYKARRFDTLGEWRPSGFRLKAYSIHLEDAAPPSEAVVAAARHVAEQVLPQAARDETGEHKLGFAILHQGLAGTWLLANWWAHGNICCQQLSRAEPGSAVFNDMGDRPLLACVYELAVIDHERRAWVAHMLQETPDPSGYLADVLPSGLH